RVVSKGPAVVLHRHHPLPGAGHLPVVDHRAPGAVPAPGLNVLAEQHGNSLLLKKHIPRETTFREKVLLILFFQEKYGHGKVWNRYRPLTASEGTQDHLAVLRGGGDLGDGVVV